MTRMSNACLVLWLVSLFGLGHLGQSPWRPIPQPTHHNYHQGHPNFNSPPIKQSDEGMIITSDSAFGSVSPPAGASAFKTVFSRIQYDGTPNANKPSVGSVHSSRLSYNRAVDHHEVGLGLNVIRNADGGQGHAAMSVSSYVGSPPPPLTSTSTVIQPRHHFNHSQTQLLSSVGHQQTSVNRDEGHRMDGRARQLHLDQAKPPVLNDYDQNRNPIHNYNQNKYLKNNFYGQHVHERPINVRPPVINPYDQNKNPIENVKSDSYKFQMPNSYASNYNYYDQNQNLNRFNAIDHGQLYKNADYDRPTMDDYDPYGSRPSSYGVEEVYATPVYNSVKDSYIDGHFNYNARPTLDGRHSGGQTLSKPLRIEPTNLEDPVLRRLAAVINRTLFYGDFDFRLPN